MSEVEETTPKKRNRKANPFTTWKKAKALADRARRASDRATDLAEKARAAAEKAAELAERRDEYIQAEQEAYAALQSELEHPTEDVGEYEDEDAEE